MKKLILIPFLSLSALVSAEQKNDDSEQLMRAIPELAQELQTANRSGAASMKCLVDTPAFDQFNTGFCFGASFANLATAVFVIDNAPSNFTILWSNSSCSAQSTYCSVPIRQYDSVNMSATVLNNANNTFTTTSATAYYEGFD